MSKDEQGYSGWTNYETWNVALWIGNDEGLYHEALLCKDYDDFAERMRQFGEDIGDKTGISRETPDGVAWNDSGLDTDELDKIMSELRD